MTVPPTSKTLLDRLGLSRPVLRAWAMYDWAISSFQTTISTAVFPIFFVSVAGAGQANSTATERYATANTVAAVIVALLSPLLGALSDLAGAKKKLLLVSMIPAILAVAGMFFIRSGDMGLALTLFIISTIGATASTVFYEALLPHIAEPSEVDRVSTAGYAFGYVGGGVLLALNLAWIQRPEWFGLPHGPDLSAADATLPVRLAFVSVAVWWLVFSIPLFRRVPEPPAAGGRVSLIQPFRELGQTLHELRKLRHAFLMLVAFMIYNDGIQTIIKMATAYGTEIGIPRSALITAIMVVQFVGIPFAFLFGILAGRIGAKRCIFLGLMLYTAISIIGYNMKTATHFFILAVLVGTVQGGTQALSRSLFASLVPAHKSGEFFGFYSVFEKFASIFGPLVFAIAIRLTGASRSAILSVIAFFALGAWVLSRVDVDAGRAAARRLEEEFERSHPVPA